MTLQEALKVNGKARRNDWPPDNYISVRKECVKFQTESGEFIEFFMEAVLDDGWFPYSEPCKHEPILPVHYAVNGVVSIEAYQDLEKALVFPKCRCGKKLKATGWVEVE